MRSVRRHRGAAATACGHVHTADLRAFTGCSADVLIDSLPNDANEKAQSDHLVSSDDSCASTRPHRCHGY